MRPDQANNFVCPFGFGVPHGTPGPLRTCIGTRCAAWRWSREKETEAYLKDVQATMVVESMPFNKAVQAVWAEKGGSYEKTEGYCGVGGKPE